MGQSMVEPLRIGVVAGERSGERLAADIIDAVVRLSGREVVLSGVGGAELEARGLKTLFDPDEIALMGVSAVVLSLPRLLRRISQTAEHFCKVRPDVVLLVDSPDFSHRVARKIKAADPTIRTVKYVAPTVWAWRPGRAAAMQGTIDHVLALFPFEPDVMVQLGGPTTTYVGHPLSADDGLTQVYAARVSEEQRGVEDRLKLVCLPGSRRAEIEALSKDMRETLETLIHLDCAVSVRLPTLDRHLDLVRRLTADWPVTPHITTGRAAQLDALAWCDAALCASGTVTLELALAGVPAVSIYRTDPVMRMARSMITTWSAALPNIIADRPVIAEFYDQMIRPGMLARHLRELCDPRSLRHALIMEGYSQVRDRMHLASNPSELAARVLLDSLV